MRAACCLLFLLSLAFLALHAVSAESNPSDQAMARTFVEAGSYGAQLYADNCSVCHGATGLGLTEAKQAFPPDHRRCQRCHKPGNPPVMTLVQVERRQHDLFDIGDPPALKGDGAMAAEVALPVLRAYIAAAMPRYRPGALAPEEYDALAEFLLELNGR